MSNICSPRRCLVVLLAAGLLTAIGLQERRIATLEAERDHLSISRASADSAPFPTPSHRPSAHGREDPATEARAVLDDLLRVVHDQQSGNVSLPRNAELAEHIRRLDSRAIRALVATLIDDTTLDPAEREHLLVYFLKRLAADHPREALDLVGQLENSAARTIPWHQVATLRAAALEAWAAIDPEAPWIWLRETLGPTDAIERRPQVAAILKGTARLDPGAALRAADAHGITPDARLISWAGQTGDEKHRALDALREWATHRDLPRTDYLEQVRALILDKPHDEPLRFAEVTGWIDRANLADDELRFFHDPSMVDLGYHIDPAETDKWIEWLVRKFSEETARERVAQLTAKHQTERPPDPRPDP